MQGIEGVVDTGKRETIFLGNLVEFQNWSLPSFFLTSTTGAAQGLVEG